MGGGLVLFGIGSDVAGGLVEGLGGGDGNRDGGNQILEREEQRAEQRVRVNPNDAAAWAALARTRFQLASQGDNYDRPRSTYTAKGRAELTQAANAWERHLALAGERPDVDAARLMVQAYAPNALDQPAKGVRAAEVVAEAQPSSQTYFQLALYAYAAGQTRKGDLAGKRAVELAPEEQRPTVKAQVDQAKKQGGFPAQPGG